VKTPRPWDIGTGVQGYAWDAPRPRAALPLQHGFGEYAERYVDRYSALIPRLLDIGISVYAFDLQGHGRSPGRRALTDVERAVADHLAARRTLETQPLPVFLLGHSLGGIVTATSVVRDPRGVEGVILSSAALYVRSNVLTRAVARLLAAIAPTFPLVRLDAAGISRDPEQVRAFAQDPLVYHGRMPARLAASILFAGRGNWARYPEWRVPTLVLHGTADSFTDPEGSRRLVSAIASRDKTLHLVEGGYHELLNDSERDETLRVVLTWLEHRLPRDGGGVLSASRRRA
jgi:acylglycerol lipase